MGNEKNAQKIKQSTLVLALATMGLASVAQAQIDWRDPATWTTMGTWHRVGTGGGEWTRPDPTPSPTDIKNDPNAVSVLWTTPGTYTWTVPAGVTQIYVELEAGAGGGSAGGMGVARSGTLDVTPGQNLVLLVGGNASGRTGGYGGGGEGGEKLVTKNRNGANAATGSFGGGGGGAGYESGYGGGGGGGTSMTADMRTAMIGACGGGGGGGLAVSYTSTPHGGGGGGGGGGYGGGGGGSVLYNGGGVDLAMAVVAVAARAMAAMEKAGKTPYTWS